MYLIYPATCLKNHPFLKCVELYKAAWYPGVSSAGSGDSITVNCRILFRGRPKPEPHKERDGALSPVTQNISPTELRDLSNKNSISENHLIWRQCLYKRQQSFMSVSFNISYLSKSQFPGVQVILLRNVSSVAFFIIKSRFCSLILLLIKAQH